MRELVMESKEPVIELERASLEVRQQRLRNQGLGWGSNSTSVIHQFGNGKCRFPAHGFSS